MAGNSNNQQTTLPPAGNDGSPEPQNAPVDVEKIRAEAKKEAEDALKAEREQLNADREELAAEKASAKSNSDRAKKEAARPALSKEDQSILDLVNEGNNADKVSGKLGVTRKKVIQVAYSNMNGESVYELAERLGAKVNEVYKVTGQKDLVRYVQEEDESGNRTLKELDYEA